MNINLTLIGQTITFVVFVWFCLKFIWPPLIKALNERKTRIADGLAAAERGKQELEAAMKNVEKQLTEARAQAQEILSQADKRATQIVEDAKIAAKAEGDRLIAGAKAEIGQEVLRAKEVLRAQVGLLAVTAAEKILRREVDAKAHAALIHEVEVKL